MPKFIVSATETNTYSMEVEAVSEEYARMKANLEMIDGDWIHVDNDFTVTEVVEIGE
jgi:hypothetical protein